MTDKKLTDEEIKSSLEISTICCVKEMEDYQND